MIDLIFKKEVYTTIGLCMKVQRTLGPGFKEVVYKDALEMEFMKNLIPYYREKSFKVEYDKATLKHGFTADFVVYNSIVLEIKAATCFHYDDFGQALNYLKASKLKLALLINFG